MFGDESTKFFHAAATERYRLNAITSMKDEDGRAVVEHFEKAALLWNTYKNRMGVTENPQMLFNLEDLVNRHNDLDELVQPFSRKEIDNVINKMANDKAPGPDGFNGMFLKKCWHIIKEDIYQLCDDFFEERVSIQAINSSFITLVPKSNNPTTVSDFRLISLLNLIVKLLTKLMANRLQKRIIPLLHLNQYGFIKGRTIQDCLAWSFEYIHQCQHSKRELVILKLDFEKAFDTVEHSAIIEVMQAMGFPDIWTRWVKNIFSSGSASILLNGVPGKSFYCKRGVRQGDPLSPLLFVLAAELLQCIMNRGHQNGIFTLPIEADPSNKFPIIQYADDTILVMRASQRELFCLKGILQSFAKSTGLKVNYSKSNIIPLNLSEDQAQNLASTFGCKLG